MKRILATKLILAAALALSSRVMLAQRPITRQDRPPTVSDLRVGTHAVPKPLASTGPAAPQLGSVPLQYRDCTTIAYQEWTDDNWELFVTAGDGSSPLRLTENTSDDEAPAMSTGCGRIVFSADRDSNQDIYAMQPDGSDTQRLTSQPARDVLPALSPDGTTVAFQTYRHGDEPEIYLYDLATGTESRLTNDQTYDGQPDWSPDSQRVAYISDRSGYRNIWIVDRDGTNAQQITNVDHAAAPKWSPDGQHIAFASDDIGTGFTSLWLVDVDGSDPHLVLRAEGSQSDAWPDDWSYDSRYILFEEANWDYDSGWYITGSSLDIVDPDQTTDRQRLVTGGVSMAGAWALCDTTPPTVTMQELPDISQSPISLVWQGTDTHSSIITYQVQYRAGGATSWTTWLDGTTSTSAEFAWETLGGTIAFRVRGIDILGNVSAWAPDDEGSLTTIPADISGAVHDARGIPLPDAVVGCLDSPLDSATTDAQGAFSLSVASSQTPSILASVSSLKPQSLALPEFTNAQGLRFWLTADNDAIQNGGFSKGLVGWYAEGSVAPIEDEIGYGEGCLLMGQASLCGAPSAVSRTFISQPIDVPDDMQHPTLSLMYALGDGSSVPEGEMSITFAWDGGTTETYQTTTSTSWLATPSGIEFPLWDHAWIDMSPWQGQPITITVAHEKSLGHGMMLVDEITLCDWKTPQITSVRPATLAVGVGGAVAVSGHNLAAETVLRLGDQELTTSWDGSALNATVPSDLAQGLYDIWAINPDGLSSVKQQGLSIGGYCTAPLVVAP